MRHFQRSALCGVLAFLLCQNVALAQNENTRFQSASTAFAQQDFQTAVTHYEEYVQWFATHREQALQANNQAEEHAVEALQRALLLRMTLREEAAAQANLRRFEQLFGASASRRSRAQRLFVEFLRWQRERIAPREQEAPLAVASTAQERAQWQRVQQLATEFLRRHGASSTLDLRMQATEFLATAYWKLGDRRNALTHFQAVVAAWNPHGTNAQGASAGPAPGEQLLREQISDDPDARDAAIANAREHFAAARFYLNQPAFDTYNTRRLPQFRGVNTEFERWNANVLLPWIQQQLRELNGALAEQAVAVANLRVPRWELASYLQLSNAFLRFAEDLRAAQVPPSLLPHPQLVDQYNNLRDEFALRFVTIASSGYERCIARATETHWYDHSVTACAEALTRIDRHRWMQNEMLPPLQTPSGLVRAPIATERSL